MLQSLSFPLMDSLSAELGGWNELGHRLAECGLDGIEGIWSGDGELSSFPNELLTGYHLTFFPDWLDMYRLDESALRAKFGSLAAAERFYGGLGRDFMLETYRRDLDRAKALGAKYVVFHVSDVSLEECYTYRWLHSDSEVIDASAECVNLLLDGDDGDFDFLLESQWWPGFTFTDPRLTRRMMDAVVWPGRGIMLDTGHLMNANRSLKTQREGAEYILAMLAEHGELCRYIKGVHLHQSLSGEYAEKSLGALPEGWPEDYIERFCMSYGHILKLDRHEPWSEPYIFEAVRRIAPKYLTHELAAEGAADRLALAQRQLKTLEIGKNIFPNGEKTDVR